jgi:hypothetical protein
MSSIVEVLPDGQLPDFGEVVDRVTIEKSRDARVNGGSMSDGYMSNWSYSRELPIIKYLYEFHGRAIPPSVVLGVS